MKRLGIYLILLCFLCCGCEAEQKKQREAGSIGGERPITRELAAKTIALAFFSREELQEKQGELPFSDVKREDTFAPYILGCVEKGFFAGDETGTFRPKEEVSLSEAQILLDRLAPDHESRMVLTEENKNMAVAYDLWMELFQTALQAGRGEKDLSSYGIETKTAVLLSAEKGLFDCGRLSSAGEELSPYENSRLRFLEKDGEILGLLSVEAVSPVLKNIFCKKQDRRLVFFTGDGEISRPLSGDCAAGFSEGIADVRLEGGRVTEVLPAVSLGKRHIHRADETEVCFREGRSMKWEETAGIYTKSGKRKTPSALLSGTETTEFFERDGRLAGAVVRKMPFPETMRVLLNGRVQKSMALSAEGGFVLSGEKTKQTFSAREKLTMRAEDARLAEGILTAEGKSGFPMKLECSDGKVLFCEGKILMEKREGGFSTVNELPFERYVMGLLPEGVTEPLQAEAGKAAAVALRSCAYNGFYENEWGAYGAQVSDRESGMVYVGAAHTTEAEQAVRATEGVCAVTEGRVAKTFVYGVSGGFGAGAEEAWGEKEKPYLRASQRTESTPPDTEEGWLAFFRDETETAGDSHSPWHRWKTYFGRAQLTEILAETLPKVRKKDPEAVQKTDETGTPLGGEPKALGKLCGVTVSERGKGGIVKALLLNFEKGTVRVKKEWALREVLSPMKRTAGEEIYLQRKTGASLAGAEELPSAYFSVKEMKKADGTLTGITLYGGGLGSGVGMSICGAEKMAEGERMAEEILSAWFEGVRTEKIR